MERYRFGLTLTSLIAAFLLILFWNSVVVAEKPGYQGIYWSRFFGGTSYRILGEGSHLKFPWDEIISYDVRLAERHGTSYILTADGLPVETRWSVRFYPKASELPRLNQTIGRDFGDTYVVPEVIAALRQTLGRHRAQEIYASDETALNRDLESLVKSRVNVQPIFVEHVLITHLALPPTLVDGILKKELSEQNLQSYRFRIDAEEKERERKVVEAEGLRDFEQISKVSPLKWQGIQATVDLAKSPNTKIIVLGTSAKDLPLLMNTEK
jgi:regulator of protease activity HflC (stomatin/prohibitin superfamily)